MEMQGQKVLQFILFIHQGIEEVMVFKSGDQWINKLSTFSIKEYQKHN